MRFSINIHEHDIKYKSDRILEFLSAGDKVKLTIVLRGREMHHKDAGFTIINDIVAGIKSKAEVQKLAVSATDTTCSGNIITATIQRT